MGATTRMFTDPRQEHLEEKSFKGIELTVFIFLFYLGLGMVEPGSFMVPGQPQESPHKALNSGEGEARWQEGTGREGSETQSELWKVPFLLPPPFFSILLIHPKET